MGTGEWQRNEEVFSSLLFVICYLLFVVCCLLLVEDLRRTSICRVGTAHPTPRISVEMSSLRKSCGD